MDSSDMLVFKYTYRLLPPPAKLTRAGWEAGNTANETPVLSKLCSFYKYYILQGVIPQIRGWDYNSSSLVYIYLSYNLLLNSTLVLSLERNPKIVKCI